VAGDEQGLVRLFTLDTGTQAGGRLRDALREAREDAGARAAEALGLAQVDPWWISLVQQRDIAEIGLEAYLSDGHGVPEDQMAEAAEALLAAGQTLLVVQSRAITERPATLQPAGYLTAVAAFDTRQSAEPARPMRKAAPATPPPAPQPAPTPVGPGARRLVLPALLAAAVLVIVLALLGTG